jgi:hypothetical protein
LLKKETDRGGLIRLMTHTIKFKNEFRETQTLKTTLYDLIESILDELNEDEARLTVQVVLYMLKSNEAKFINDVQKSQEF